VVVLTGPEAPLARWREKLAGDYRPGAVVVQLPDGIAGLPETLARPAPTAAQARVCRGTQCLAPTGGLVASVAARGSSTRAGASPPGGTRFRAGPQRPPQRLEPQQVALARSARCSTAPPNEDPESP